MKRFIFAAKAGAAHLAISAAIALVAALIIFFQWFPYPFRQIAGGLHLFWIAIGVDIVCGPLLTLILFSPSKSRQELTLDMALIGLIQLTALVYGIYSVSQARPVILAFESDRFVVVSAAQIDPDTQKKALPQWHTLSWAGPVLVGTRNATSSDEVIQSLDMSMHGLEPSARPDWWQGYNDSRPNVVQRMKKMTDLWNRLPKDKQAVVDRVIQKIKQPIEKIHYLPLVSQKILDEWIVLLDEQANIIGYAPVDGFS